MWQSIKTAPKTGESILGAVAGAQVPAIIKWVKTTRGGKWVALDEEDFDSMADWDEYVSSTDFPSTHWQPLPAMPSTSQKDPSCALMSANTGTRITRTALIAWLSGSADVRFRSGMPLSGVRFSLIKTTWMGLTAFSSLSSQTASFLRKTAQTILQPS